jgi:hypothetical protein
VEKCWVVLVALREAQADKVKKIVEAEATPSFYATLRSLLVASHQLTPLFNR